ncbi:HGR037Cp [Eremothecium sinecaudum]|uniref:HGR037Cp n=1 Tax=Eremothecium sinecaudum TaxID=45286 RepID=A0A0X8HV98_9SACH|nr:HGR037Cp [Eremothecium sinecaudum]AMD22376.1 HGR037Cp [Eremothecium sinecaudum]
MAKVEDGLKLEKTLASQTEYVSSSSGENERTSLLHRFVDSFKRVELGEVQEGEDGEDGETKTDIRVKLKQDMRKRHVWMMSLGTGIGTGLLVANANSLRFGGPAALLIGYILVSMVSYVMMNAAGEMAVTYPTLPGGYNSYSSIFISKPIGFATTWVYCLQWVTVLPLELITATIVIKYWLSSYVPLFITIFYLMILFVHFFGVWMYGETEFFCNAAKVIMITMFLILGVIVNCGGIGNSGYIGAKYWNDPGAFVEGSALQKIKGIAFVLVTGYFSYGGMELYALSVNELPNPRRAIPSACKKGIYRILIVYITSMALVTFLVPHDSDQLVGAGFERLASPYVIAMSLHGVKVVPHIINAVILISVISVANSAMFSGPRLLCALAEQGYAPKFLDYVDRTGRPLTALLACSIAGLLAYTAVAKNEVEIFEWLAAIAGLSEVFTWGAICLSHYRFRKAMKHHGKSLDTVGYKSKTGALGSFVAVFFCGLVLVAQLWVAISPMNSAVKPSANAFFKLCMALPIWIFSCIGYCIYSKNWKLLNPIESIDVDYGRRIYDAEVLKQEEFEYAEMIKNRGWRARIVAFWC